LRLYRQCLFVITGRRFSGVQAVFHLYRYWRDCRPNRCLCFHTPINDTAPLGSLGGAVGNFMYNVNMIFALTPLNSSDIILLVTGIIILIYTRAAQRANEIQIMPTLLLSFKETTQSGNSSRDGKILMKNIGRGPAYDIDILPLVANEGDRPYTYTFYVQDRLLETDKEEELKEWVKTPNGGVESSGIRRFLFRLIPPELNPRLQANIQAERPALFIINYKGLNGKNYHSIYRLYSVLPPVGDIVMQLLHQGRCKANFTQARWYHLIKPTIIHEGNTASPRANWITKITAILHKKFH